MVGNKMKRLARNYLLARGWRPSAGIPIEATNVAATFHYDKEEQVRRALAIVRDHTMISFERAATLWQQIRYLDRYQIEGAVVECGVWKGGAVGLSALAHLASGGPPRRHLHLFDSFEGLPEPNADVDGEEAVRLGKGGGTGQLRTTNQLVAESSIVRTLLETSIGYPKELIHYHEGWFQETLPRDTEGLGGIALLRLDGDWYESTTVCLEYLYPKVVKHGVVVVDDYGHFEGCRRAVDEFMIKEKNPVFLSHVDYTCRYFIKTN
jgi:O-methyltransferase